MSILNRKHLTQVSMLFRLFCRFHYETRQIVKKVKDVKKCFFAIHNQRSLVENIIGQLRRLLPRKMPLSELTAANLQKAEHYINHRPRPSKGFNTSHCLFFGKISCRNS